MPSLPIRLDGGIWLTQLSPIMFWQQASIVERANQEIEW
ncbi:hypothetical protein U14_02904 [Candidatus Moduliflexus flocculans]|uniref:Uncharacterized protein n=1 Tax=Candidatus Moduliflexus flocculans TaxID=1499966 RepID=A0A081BMP3_9BACT|nr:hypothetical protein U14_02904 [Candidatus Moduliflexus flocculans]